MQSLVRNVDVLTQGLKYSISGLMNLANQTAESQSGAFFVNFNQDCTSLSVGSKAGYRIFSVNSVDYLENIYENDTDDICIVERLFSSSLIAVVTYSSPRKLKVCHFKKEQKYRLVVCLEESLYIHNIRDMKVLHTIRDTPPNVAGLCILSINSDNCYLAYPGSNTIGEVQIFDAINLQAKTMIPAHDSPLAALAFSPSGTKVATASEKGTVIRVFQVHDGAKLFEFRRGLKRFVSISSLAFSMDSMFLCSNYLPSQVTDVFNQGRAFASVHLPFQGLKNVCAITTIEKVLRLLVANADGYLYIYDLDPDEGGDCTLLKQHRLDGKQDEVDCASVSNIGPSTGEGTASVTPAAPIVQNPESEKYHEMIAATESPPKGGTFRLDDDTEFPPVTQRTD
ncbi:hypothetical protein G9C98_000186 [Cotesia typhae]|uniref:WD repeat domain phosphoinositide-interacting protein 2 n=1 Tax=Cotesia typhae TaxID=2053667 RepID=A0A8J5UYP9_9HYME|nr:hypothetical protein G9C98_000186 [Cotesia typhae]